MYVSRSFLPSRSFFTSAAAASTCYRLRQFVDDIVCVITPEPFYAVSAWYDDFSQTTDEEVASLISPQQHANRN